MTYEIKDPAARAAFEKWRATRKRFDDISVHAAGSGLDGGGGPGYGYDPGWIADLGHGNGRYYTMGSNEDCMANTLEDAEAWLWNHYAVHEVGE